MECAQQTEDAGTAATSARERRGLRSVVVYTARLSLGDCTAGSAGTPTRTVEPSRHEGLSPRISKFKAKLASRPTHPARTRATREI
jgi:hypothetical protein